MQTYVTCSWCHGSNPAGEVFCRSCGHEAGAARMSCRCSQCEAGHQRWLAEAGGRRIEREMDAVKRRLEEGG